jgi:hypothetical protein
MATESQSEMRSFMPFAPFFNAFSENPAEAWKDGMRVFYQGVMDAWNTSMNAFGAPLAEMKGRPEDIMQLSGLLWKESCSSLATIEDRMEALKKYAKAQQDGGQQVYRAFADCVSKISSAQQNGGIEKAFRACLEAHGGLLETIQSSVLDQTNALFDCWRSFIPADSRVPKTRKEKAA